MTALIVLDNNPRLRLVGGQCLITSDGASEELLDFYGGLFGRLTREVQHTGDLTRYVGFQSSRGEEGHLHIFGLEVDSIEGIPEGMVAWDLSSDVRTVWQAQDGKDTIVSEEEIDWTWCHPGDGRWTGEFVVRPSGASMDTKGRPFWISANAYVDLGGPAPSSDEVHLVDYDPAWPKRFREFAGWLRDTLGPEVAMRIEHYGSTAIPGIPAKPVIDVLVEVPSFREAKRRMVPLLNDKMWEYWWYSDHMVFIKRNRLMGRRTHHLHVAPRGHRIWEGIAFRDYLRSHPEEASRYATLKLELAASYREDRERYTQAKTAFVREISTKAVAFKR